MDYFSYLDHEIERNCGSCPERLRLTGLMRPALQDKDSSARAVARVSVSARAVAWVSGSGLAVARVSVAQLELFTGPARARGVPSDLGVVGAAGRGGPLLG